MGCSQSKSCDVDFSQVDKRRNEKIGLDYKTNQSTGNVGIMKTIAKQAKPIMDSMVLTDATPKLSKQVVATATVVMGTRLTHKQGAHHLRNIFVPPLNDVCSFIAPIFQKSIADKQLIREALKNNFVFAACSERELRTIVDAFEEFSYVSHENIIVQGDVGDYFYVMKKGKVRFEINKKKVGTAKEGDSFGELALLYSSPRAASAIAEKNVTLYRVDQMTFKYIMQSQTISTEKAKKILLKEIEFLKFLDISDINKLVHTMVPRVFIEGECITKVGEEGDTLYVIQEGSVKVTEVTAESTKKKTDVLGPSDYFGEMALLHREDHSKIADTVVAISVGLALTIDKETFEHVVGDITSLIILSKEKVKLATIPILKNSNLSEPIFASLASLFVEKTYPPNSLIIAEGTQHAAFYIVRSGQVIVNRQDEKSIGKIYEAGSYFGEEMFEVDIGGLKESSNYRPSYSVSTLSESVVVGTLSIDSCRNVIDTTNLGNRQKYFSQREKGESAISMKDLERHRILGAGTFGQVWLVSHIDTEGNRSPFALKIQSKYELIKNNQARGVVQEKKIMTLLCHPFLTQLRCTYQDKNYIYMLLGLVQGGELYSVLHSTTSDGIDENRAVFYASGILEGLSHMHQNNILYRDIKPENVLIDKDGYPVIIDFGFAKVVHEKTYTLCGTPLYLAPEVILNRGHDKAADHWSFGVLSFEMIEGKTPFYREGMDQIQLFRCICKGKYNFPPGVMTPEMEDLIHQLFVLDPAKRIGSLAKGINEIYVHPWFIGVDFAKLRQKELKAPWVPEIDDPLDTHNFEAWDHLEDKTKKYDTATITADQQRIFRSF